MDFRSLDKADLIASDVIYPHYVSESFNVFHNESQQWYYVADQMPHDILIFKSFDSKPGVASGKRAESPHRWKTPVANRRPQCVLTPLLTLESKGRGRGRAWR